MMRYLNFFLFFAFLISCDSQNTFESPAESYFVRFYGEDGDHEGVDFVANSDGSFILLGNERVSSELGQQIYLVKVDAQGMVVKKESFGMTGDDFAKDIELTPDGNIIIAAETQKGPNDRDVYVITVTQDLSLLNNIQVGLKTIAGQESDEEVNSISIIQSGYIVAGSTTAVETENASNLKDALHIRLNNSLVPLDPEAGRWNNTSGFNDSDDVLIKMVEIDTKTYYGFGYTDKIRNSSRDYKYWVFELGEFGEAGDDNQDLLDIGSTVEDEILSAVIESPVQSGEGFILSGIKTNSSDESRSFIVKLSKELVSGQDNLMAEQSPTGLGNLENIIGISPYLIKRSNMKSLNQGGFLLLSSSKVLSNDKLNISLIKLSNTFEVVWQTPVFFGGAGDDFAGSVTELADGKIIIIGTMTLGGVTGQTKMVLMKLNSEGKLVP